MKAIQECLPLVGRRAAHPTPPELRAPEILDDQGEQLALELDDGDREEDAADADKDLGNRAAKRSLARVRARAAGYVRRHPRLMLLNDREREIASIIVTVFRYDKTHVRAATSFLAKRVGDRTGEQPSYGATYRVLEFLARIGFVQWIKAHVPKHHGRLEIGDTRRVEALYPSPRHYRAGQRDQLAQARGKEPPGVHPCRELQPAGEVERIFRGRHPEGDDRAPLSMDTTSSPDRDAGHQGSIQPSADPPIERPPPLSWEDRNRFIESLK